MVLSLMLPIAAALADEPHPGANAFVERAAEEHGLNADLVRAVLAEARYQQSIIDAISRPAEARPWFQYHPIFLTETRIAAGAEFWRANESLLVEVAERFEVPIEVLVAIVGVETNYGLNTGSYRVIDALATLGFYYPKRSRFFSGELASFLRLVEEEGLPATEIKGSYAGAMGVGQFIPSSYRAYAVDFDGSGRRDLWRSLPDALGSVANYLSTHGWEPGRPIVLPVERIERPLDVNFSLKPEHSLAELAGMGVQFDAGELPEDTPATLVELELANGHEHWVGLNNFYVITRYNRSPLYAMAVALLADSVREQSP